MLLDIAAPLKPPCVAPAAASACASCLVAREIERDAEGVVTTSSSTMWAFLGSGLLCATCAGGGSERPAPAEPAAAADAEPAPPVQPAADGGAPAETAAGEIAIGAADAGRQIDLPAGQALVLTLESNVTTGYSWAVTRVDESVLRLDGEPRYQEGGATGVVGAPGAQTFRFLTVAPGATDLELDYRRPWETGVAPIRTFSARVVVR
jgi:inhibitor of cysteine peptidase